MTRREAIINDLEEFMPNVSGNIRIKRRVEPYYIPTPGSFRFRWLWVVGCNLVCSCSRFGEVLLDMEG